MRKILCAVVVLVFCFAIPCSAKDKFSVYGGYSYFMPTSTTTRDAFGSAWPQLTVGRLEKEKPEKWTATYDLASFRRSGDYDALLIPITVGVQRQIGKPGTNDIQPYVALRAGPYYGKVDNDDLGVSEERIGLNANAAVGIVIQKNYLLEARYDYFNGRMDGFRLDGFSIVAGVKLFDF